MLQHVPVDLRSAGSRYTSTSETRQCFLFEKFPKFRITVDEDEDDAEVEEGARDFLCSSVSAGVTFAVRMTYPDTIITASPNSCHCLRRWAFQRSKGLCVCMCVCVYVCVCVCVCVCVPASSVGGYTYAR